MADKETARSTTLTTDEAGALTARLEALARTARIFGSGIADVDVSVSWSLEPGSEEIRWFKGPSGRQSVDIRLELNHMIDMLHSVPGGEGPGGEPREATYVQAFKTGFLHELGHILFSPGPVGVDINDEAQLKDLTDGLSERQRSLLQSPQLRRLLETVHHTLEDGRIERSLMGSFRGARRYLETHAERALRVAYGEAQPGSDPGIASTARGPLAPSGDLHSEEAAMLSRLVALLFLDFWGWEGWDDSRIPPRVARAAQRLSRSLDGTNLRESPVCLSRWVVEQFLPELDGLMDLEEAEEEAARPGSGQPPPEAETGETAEQDNEAGAPPEQTATPPSFHPETDRQQEGEPGGKQEADGPLSSMAQSLEEQFVSPGLLAAGNRPERAAVMGAADAREDTSRIIMYPHVSGGYVLDEISVARARTVRRSERSRRVLADVARTYGPRALDAFAAEAAALRRAFQVNFERRYEGRYRAGRHIGIRNLRRYLVADDLRIFQRLEVPDRLSYYIHLLLDVSPSMLTNRNLQKAMAIGYAFAEALDTIRVPVDVSLYSSAITELYDHRRDTLDLYFGGDFGYLSSGTHEIEAIAYAKQEADKVSEERKIIVVTTDGQPNSAALQRAGSDDLRSYYREHLIPWLRGAGVDLLAIGIGSTPSYHPNAATISSGWESIGVLMKLLDEIIARGQTSHAVLWR